MKDRAHRIGFGLGERADGTPIGDDERAAIIRQIAIQTAHRFGGYTIAHTYGGWINPAGRLVEEPGITLTIVTDEPDSTVRAFARYHGGCTAFQQSVIHIRPAGTADFVEC
jgi:hypothetical protein